MGNYFTKILAFNSRFITRNTIFLIISHNSRIPLKLKIFKKQGFRPVVWSWVAQWGLLWAAQIQAAGWRWPRRWTSGRWRHPRDRSFSGEAPASGGGFLESPERCWRRWRRISMRKCGGERGEAASGAPTPLVCVVCVCRVVKWLVGEICVL